jgi:hypothetical protein
MTNTQPQQRYEIGVLGLGIMGRNFLLNMLMPVLEVWAAAPPSDFPNYAAGTWGPEDTQGLLANGHSWPLPTELVGQCKKKGKNP